MKRHRSADSGFSLIEIMVVLIMMGILAAIAAPSFLSQKQSMRKAISSTTTLLKTVNLTARANSGNPYRITTGSRTTSEGTYQYFKVETEVAGICDLPRAAGDTPKWKEDPVKELALPTGIGIVNFPTLATTNGICFDGRGATYRGAASNTPITFDLVDTNSANNKGSKAVKVTFNISAVGDITAQAYDKNDSKISEY
jgi:prepilin-type N-terminal cleavage/methylation domain-containing protein